MKTESSGEQPDLPDAPNNIQMTDYLLHRCSKPPFSRKAASQEASALHGPNVLQESSVNTGEHLQGSDHADQQSRGLKAVTQAGFHCATIFDKDLYTANL